MNHKILLFIICSVFLFLTWCSQSPIKTPETIESGNLFTSIPEMTGREEIRQWSLGSSIIISGIYHSIILSWNRLIYSGIFTITIPQYLESREYVSRNDIISKTITEWMGFTDQSKQKAATFHVQKLVRPQSKYATKKLCKKEYMDWLLSQSESIKTIQWRSVYMSYAVLQISGLDVEPRRAEEMQFCFVDTGILYTFSISNYTKAYMEEVVDSLVFN